MKGTIEAAARDFGSIPGVTASTDQVAIDLDFTAEPDADQMKQVADVAAQYQIADTTLRIFIDQRRVQKTIVALLEEAIQRVNDLPVADDFAGFTIQ